ncbi:multidrug efflux system membrane fusion protein [Hoeflea marina]|uniref:Multidrug efflux system membrane fusion protein n=1 Tax=Hoeflea marina TaxID=274592 RepID=A0A317PHK0_9HYPH|nr:efflux RND transporter periplasmic adaptor subunit [Hoeflea marina]PWV98918.1 multidrug efflux system membrane fusion protein [Hoeflea marina]
MPRIRFHTVAAFVVLAVSAAWVATGEFASVGSAADEANKAATEKAAAEAAKPDKPLRTVAVVTPEFVDHNRIVRVSGVTEADKKATLATRDAGVIDQLNVDEGDLVKTGDVILTLEGPDKQAMVETARALLAQREKEAENVNALVKRGISPTAQSDNARSALAAAKSQLETAQADLDRLRVTAPFDGVIDDVMVEKGSWAPSGRDAVVLLKLDPMIARGEVSERDLSHIRLGGQAEVKLISGQSVSGTVRYVSREATAQTRTFPVEIAVPNPDTSIPAGMTAEIGLKADPVKAVKLPRSVVTLDPQGNLGVRILRADGKVGFVEIDLIDDTPDGLILGGIPEDARIIVAGQDLVSDGDQVNAVDAGAELLARAAAGSN